MTAEKLIENEISYRREHGMKVLRYAKTKNGDAIAAFDEKQNRFVCVAGKLLSTGDWEPMRFELFIGDEPAKMDWVEVLS